MKIFMDNRSVGVRSLVAKSTSISSGQSNKSFLSPGGSPRVLDNPEFVSNADKEDTVVESGFAVVENT